MTAVTGTLSIVPSLTYLGDTDVGPAASKVLQDALATLNADGADLAPTVMVADVRTLASGANETLDFTAIGEALAGKSVSLTKIYALILVGADANVTAITFGAAASNAWTGPMGGTAPTIDLEAGVGAAIAFLSAEGWDVDSSHKSFKAANASGATASYTLIILGE